MFSIKLDSKRYNLRSSNTGRLDVLKNNNRNLSFNGPKLLNNLDSETRQEIFLSVFFCQKYLFFYLALTVINLLNRSLYKIFILYSYYVHVYIYLFILCIYY